ncbi:MAG: hypothetical protein ACYSWQ_05510 [Planctomycetota bacterium]
MKEMKSNAACAGVDVHCRLTPWGEACPTILDRGARDHPAKLSPRRSEQGLT